MTALVTGAAGFVGSTLAETLIARGERVIGVDCFLDYYPRAAKERNLASFRDHERFEFLEAAIQDLPLDDLLKRVDHVFHLAAQAGVRASWGEEFSIYTDNNILATQRLLEAAVVARPKSFVFASSSSVYGDRAVLPMTEDVPLHPLSPYGVSKLAAERLCALYHENHGTPTVSLRYFTVYGPRQRPDMAFHRILACARSGTAFSLFGDGKQTRDFTFIDDAVAATMAAAESGRPGGVYNIGGGSRVSMLDVIETVKEVTGLPLEVEVREKQKGDMRDTYADTTRAAEDLGYAPSTSLREGLGREWEWIQSL
jgi:UDP-glucose 4-epimerase